MTTVLEALKNAQINLATLGRMGLVGHPIFVIATEQLKNGIEALDNGKMPSDVLQQDDFSDVDTGKPK